MWPPSRRSASNEQSSEKGFTAIHLAAMRKRADIMQALVDIKADLEAEAVYHGRAGHRPLTIAACEGNAQLVRLLIESRADLDVRTSTGASVLHVAAWNGHSECAAALIAGKAEVNIKTADKSERTPITLATINGHVTVVGLLLGAKAEVQKSRGNLIRSGSHTPRSQSPGTPRVAPSGERRLYKMRSRSDSILEAAFFISHHESGSSLAPSEMSQMSGVRAPSVSFAIEDEIVDIPGLPDDSDSDDGSDVAEAPTTFDTLEKHNLSSFQQVSLGLLISSTVGFLLGCVLVRLKRH